MLVGCDAGIQHVAVTGSVVGPRSIHAGPTLEGRVHLPRSYQWVVGGETAHLFEVDPSTPRDQWRAALVLGYNPVTHADGGRCSYEFLWRGGFFRGSNGRDVIGVGSYHGVSFGLPVRLSPTMDPWELDDYALTQVQIVPQVSANVLLPWSRFADNVALELAGTIALRVHFTTTLMP